MNLKAPKTKQQMENFYPSFHRKKICLAESGFKQKRKNFVFIYFIENVVLYIYF